MFPVISSTLFGLQSADRSQHDLLTLHRAGRLTRLVKLQLPTAMPAILTGLQVAATLAVVGAVVGDFFFRQGDAGIGVLIDLYRARLQSEQLFGAAILACLLGVVVFSAFGLLNRLVTGGWYGSTGYDATAREHADDDGHRWGDAWVTRMAALGRRVVAAARGGCGRAGTHPDAPAPGRSPAS